MIKLNFAHFIEQMRKNNSAVSVFVDKKIIVDNNVSFITHILVNECLVNNVLK